MPRNKIEDLNNHLFEQLERLNDESLKGEKLESEIERAKAMSSIASQIIASGRLTLDAAVAVGEHNVESKNIALILKNEDQK